MSWYRFMRASTSRQQPPGNYVSLNAVNIQLKESEKRIVHGMSIIGGDSKIIINFNWVLGVASACRMSITEITISASEKYSRSFIHCAMAFKFLLVVREWSANLFLDFSMLRFFARRFFRKQELHNVRTCEPGRFVMLVMLGWRVLETFLIIRFQFERTFPMLWIEIDVGWCLGWKLIRNFLATHSDW